MPRAFSRVRMSDSADAGDRGIDAAQGVVGAEFEDHGLGSLRHRPVEPVAAAGTGIAGHPGIDHVDRLSPWLSRLFAAVAGMPRRPDRPRPALSELPSTTILIGFGIGQRFAPSAGRRPSSKPAPNTSMCTNIRTRLSTAWRKCHMTEPWTVSSNPRHRPASSRTPFPSRTSISRSARAPRAFISSRISACAWRRAKRSA